MQPLDLVALHGTSHKCRAGLCDCIRAISSLQKTSAQGRLRDADLLSCFAHISQRSHGWILTPWERAMICQCAACETRPHDGLPCRADQRQVQRGRQRQRGLQGGGRHRLRARDCADARRRARPLPLHHQGAPGQGEPDLPLSCYPALHIQEC